MLLVTVGVATFGMLIRQSLAVGLSGLALASCAWEDHRTHRFSLRVLGIATAAVLAAFLIESILGEPLTPGLGWIGVVLAVVVCAFALWSVTPGIAFGDVLLLAFAAIVPSWISPRAVLVMIGVAFLVAAAAALLRRARGAATGSLAFGPALLAGWLVAVAVG